jgi:hypothetical protein
VGAALNYAGNSLDFFTPGLQPVSNKKLNPATYIDFDYQLDPT